MSNSKRACNNSSTISKSTVKSMLVDGSVTKQWIESLSDNQWMVTNFDPSTRQVCIEVDSGVGVHTITIVLKELTY